ncbi:MAG: hypothetical protein IT168_01445 [Bryobacterales bacterium]|nr:hypothetical protein [Bryobacterales bacterium]
MPSQHAANGGTIRSLPEPPPANPRYTRFGGWPLLVVAFGSLVAMMIVSGVAGLRRTGELYNSLSELNRSYRRSWRSLDAVRSGIHVSSVLIRDYLMDGSQSRARETREELLGIRRESEQNLKALETALARSNPDEVRALRKEIDGYWESLDPVFEWDAADKQASGYAFLRHVVMPRREAALKLAGQVQKFAESTFLEQRKAADQEQQEFLAFLRKMVTATVILGLIVAIISVVWVAVLERRSARQRLRAERAQHEMRQLSQQLVHAQEEERRAISRELHDEISQMLTGLRMDLRSLKRVHRASPTDFDAHVDQTCVLLEQTLQAVRDMAMGLRPTMLDDLGLEAALRWQAREFERRHDINVTLEVTGDLGSLTDRQRTNLYRIVQEAFTNCARHSKAKSVSVILAAGADGLMLTILDDGVGIEPTGGSGLGLVGIQERVTEMGGVFQVRSTPGRGTELSVELPVHEAQLHA